MQKYLQVILVIAILVTNGIILYILLKPQPGIRQNDYALLPPHISSVNFNQPIDDTAAIANVKAFRSSAQLGSLGVLYDADTITRYLRDDYEKIKAQFPGQHPGYDWKIGFYWMFTRGKDSANRLSFCVVPTLVNHDDPTKVLDYFSPSPFYTPAAIQRAGPPPPQTGTVYNEGQLWP
jgi:hypothetical protein